ncbi:hypothetical protein [Croceicoccus gelatinilyticus]|uniref:hypothetical protein n=1 Tax=Croceicoccus gelatinilyticus TaxID=2835536 RepID=UPI001BCDCB11|nr:hypothetical protein [Croceicoccus gelatinilyticus]MBS7669366.1 hypothetical protein [Croceicoccus gelatinilyticus]
MRNAWLPLVGLAIIGWFVLFSDAGDRHSAAERASQWEENRLHDIERAGLRSLRAGMREPDAMEVRGVHVAARGLNGASVLCGEVNGRNGYGGMTGFQRFMVIADVPMTERAGGENFGGLWSDAGC